jgi:biotin carboxyl carrier protein
MHKVKINGAHTFQIESVNERFQLNGENLSFDMLTIKNGQMHFIYNNRSFTADFISENTETKSMLFKINGKLCEVYIEDQYDLLLNELGLTSGLNKSALEIKAPMPGLVLQVTVQEGQEMRKGDNLLVLEAMKMENMLKSPTDGIIKKIYISKGDKVEKNQVLIEFQ